MNERMEKESDDGQYEHNMTAITKSTCQNSRFKCQGLRTSTFLSTICVMPKAWDLQIMTPRRSL
jgi:hypothetical protein